MILLVSLTVSLGWFIVGLLACDWLCWIRRVRRERAERRAYLIGRYHA